MVTTGSAVCTRKADGRTAARAPNDLFDWLGIPDGGLILTSPLNADMDRLDLGDELRVLDPRTGKLTEHPTHVRGASGAVVVPTDEPPVTAETATAGATPRVPVIGAVVRDRRSGRELVRYVGEDDYVSVRSEGERLVISDGGRDLVVKP